MKNIVLKKSLSGHLKDYLILTLGILIYVIAWSVFLVPNNMVGGGVTGCSSILYYAFNIPMGYSYFALNGVLLIVGVIMIGAGLGFKTIYAIILASVGLNLFQQIMPVEIIDILAIKNGKLMCTIMGGMMAGAGIGMSLSVGGSTGGTDIIALCINKYRNVSPGRIIMVSDIMIILSSLLFPSYTPDGELVEFADKITTVVYGLIFVAVNSYVIDLYLSGSKQSVQVFIMSRKYAELADAITNIFHRGVTVLPAKGWYTKSESQILMVITRKTDLNLLLKYVKTIDSDAFLSVSYVTSVYGKGFDTIKGANIGEKGKKDDLKSVSSEKIPEAPLKENR